LKKYSFSEVIFTFSYHFRVLLLILITFWSALAFFEGSEKIKHPRWRIQDGSRLRT